MAEPPLTVSEPPTRSDAKLTFTDGLLIVTLPVT